MSESDATTSASPAIVSPTGFSHVRLTVTDIERSKAFYQTLFGPDLAFDFTDRTDQPGVKDDPAQLYGGCGFAFGSQLLGLRPVAEPGDSFVSTRVGLDHVCLNLASMAELRSAVQRLDEAGIEHGEIIELEGFGMAILSLQDPDDINLELNAALDS